MATRRIALSEGRRPGWHWASHEIIDIYGAKLGPYGLAIYYALCRHANQNGESWPSHATLARETGMSVTSVKKAIKRLCELELIKKQVRQYESEGPTSNLYTLLEIPTLGQIMAQPEADNGSGLGQNVPHKKNNLKKNKRKTSTTQASLFDKSTDNPKEDANDSVSDKEQVLRDFGLRGSVVAQIAKSHDLVWIRAAMAEMDNPSPGSVVYLHQEGWEPPSEEDDDVCSVCGNRVCECPDPNPEWVSVSEFERLQERRRADALRRAANPDPDRLQRFSDVHKRFPDTPHELLEFEAGLKDEPR